jgi:flagellar M-ring protein FliF
VSSVVGPGHARVQLTADFDFNRVTETSEKFDPEGRVLRSSQTREETAATTDSKQGQVTVANAVPGGATPDAGATPKDQSHKTEETVNYEISRSTKTEVTEGGRLNRVSVAVLVDGNYSKNDKGEPVYAPRDKDEIDHIAALVRSSIGFDQKRGDQVEVVNLRFAEVQGNALPEPTGLLGFLQFTKDDIMHWAEQLVMVLLGIVVLLMVVRPLVKRIITPDQPLLGGDASALGAAGGAIVGSEQLKVAPSATAKMIDVAQVQGQVHAQSVQKVGELADKNPTEAISIIRSWLHEGA